MRGGDYSDSLESPERAKLEVHSQAHLHSYRAKRLAEGEVDCGGGKS